MKKRSPGFTVAEVLIALAIMALLAAVAVPAVIRLRDDLKMRELDDCAREIFLSAQNNLTARKAAGTLGGVGDLDSDQALLLYKVDSAALLPAGALEAKVAEGYYALKLNLKAGGMVEVFYSEDDFTAEEREQIKEGQLSGAGNAAQRKAARIGYYWDGADGGSGTDGVIPLLAPWVELCNEDDLYVKVFIPEAAKQMEAAPGGFGATLTLRVEDADDPDRYLSFTLNPVKCIHSGGRVQVTLDSLTQKDEAGERISFQSLGDNLGNMTAVVTTGSVQKSTTPITPGADIRVTATLSVAGNSSYLPATGVSNVENSLFAKREMVEETDALGNVTAEKDTVSIENPRQLQNLKADYSGLFTAGACYVEQIQHIDWPTGEGAPRYLPIYSYGEIASFNGNGLEIRNLRGENGLFASVLDATISGVRLVDPEITTNAPFQATGALVGTVMGSSVDSMVIRDCRVYLTTPLSATPRTTISHSGHGAVGGLVGYVWGKATIQDSFAATYKLEGQASLGGLVGHIDGDCIIQNSYASAEQMISGEKTAAFVGNISTSLNVTIKNCFAVANIASTTGTDGVSGFFNLSGSTGEGSVTVENTYCAVTYNKADGTPTGLTPTHNFGPGIKRNCAYLTVASSNSASDGATGMGFDALSGWTAPNFSDLGTEKTHPYQRELAGKAYPFPGGKSTDGDAIPYYGSWPEVADTMLLAYYEKYTDGSYGFYAAGVNGGSTLDTLDKQNAKAVAEDGYALLSSRNAGANLTVEWKEGEANKSQVTSAAVTGLSLASPTGSTITYSYAYLLNPNHGAMAPAAGSYREVTCNGNTLQ